jgi:hypothetical protein
VRKSAGWWVDGLMDKDWLSEEVCKLVGQWVDGQGSVAWVAESASNMMYVRTGERRSR